MADPSVPAPDAAGYWHFTYITTDTLDGRWYGGKRSTRIHPLSDRYLGSGNWIRRHTARNRLRREIVAFYASSADVFAGEAELITWTLIRNDPLCMNRRDGGEGMSVEAAQALASDPAWQERVKASGLRNAANPLWCATVAAALKRTRTTPGYIASWSAGISKRNSDPSWLSNVAASNIRKATDPKWLDANAEQLRQLHADPELQERHRAAMRLVHASPAWLASVTAANKRNAKDPKWLANNASGMLKKYANPGFHAAMRRGALLREATKRAKNADLIRAQGQLEMEFMEQP